MPSITPTANTAGTEMDDRHIDFSGVFHAIYENWKIIGLITLTTTLLAVGYALFARPIYQSDILIQVEDNPNSANNVLADVQQMFETKSAASDEIDILSSRLVVSGAVEKVGLEVGIEPKYFPLVGRWVASHAKGLSTPGIFGYGGYAWGTERAAMSRFEVPDSLLGRPFQIIAEAGGRYRVLCKYADITAQGQVGVPLTIASSFGPVTLLVGQLVANPGAVFVLARVSLVHAIEGVQKALIVTEKNKDSDVFTASLRGPDPKLTQATLAEIGEQYVRQNVGMKAQEAEKSLGFLEEQLPKLKHQLEDSESAFNQFRAANATLDLTEEGTAVLQQSVDVQSKIADLEQKRSELMARFTSNHPAVIAVVGQLNTLKAQLASIEAKTRELPALEQTELRLQRDVQVNTDLYTNLLNTAEQLRLVRAGKTGNARLVDTAVVAEEPVKPNRKIVVVLGVLIGLCAGVAVAWIRSRWFGAMVQPDEVERGTALPIYAVVPLSKHQVAQDARGGVGRLDEISVLALRESDGMAVESLRSFRSALQFILLEARNNIVLISGPTPGVGKSFIAANLATVLAASNHRVLLIDADMRRGDLNQRFGLLPAPGFAEIILGNAPTHTVHRNVLPNLDVIARGHTQSNPSDLLLNPNMAKFLQNASAEYDMVIVDSPPVLAVTDATELAALAGSVFLVVRQAVTSVKQLRESIKRFSQVGVPVNGAVFNGLKSRPGSYGYSRYAYTSDTAPRSRAKVEPIVRARGPKP